MQQTTFGTGSFKLTNRINKQFRFYVQEDFNYTEKKKNA